MMASGSWWRSLLACAAVILALDGAAAAADAALPTERGYELIDPSTPAPHFIGGAAISDDGTRVTFVRQTNAPLLVSSVRTATGWRASSMMPPATELVDGVYGHGVYAYTPDRSKAIVGAYPGFYLNGRGNTTFLRLDASGQQTVFFTPAPQPTNLLQTMNVVVSDAGDHAFAVLDTPEFARGVYDLAHSAPVLVSLLPDGSTSACNADFASDTLQKKSTLMQHWNSIDGSKVFFLGSDCEGGPVGLYVRDLTSATTTAISSPAVSGPEAAATFLQASRSGDAAVYLTSAQLTGADANSGVDAYRWSEGEGNVCLTCVVADADIFGEAVASEDLSHVYFVSEHELAPGGGDGTQNLYVWHTVDGQAQIDYVSPFQFDTHSTLTNSARRLGAITPDGETLVFASRAAGLDWVSGSSNGGHLEQYRYDDTTRTLTCVSCPASGTPTKDVTTSKAVGGSTAAVGGLPALLYLRVLSDDGRRFVFVTPEPLVVEDRNDGADIYEWHDGEVDLITDGISDPGTVEEPSVALYGMSADGRDVIFTAFAKLTPDAVDRSQHLYDARLGGGFAFATERSCEGQACQAAPSSGLSLPAIGSLAFDGPAATTRSRVRIVHAGSRGGRVLLRVRVPGAGRLRASGKRVRRVGRRVSGAGVVRLRVGLTAAAAEVLRREHRVRVSVRVRYVPASGEGSSARVRVLVRG